MSGGLGVNSFFGNWKTHLKGGVPGIRIVKSQGDISWKGRHVYLSETLAGEPVGLRQETDQLWDIYFGPIRLAQLDDYEKRLIHLPRKQKQKQNNEGNKDLKSKKVLPMCQV